MVCPLGVPNAPATQGLAKTRDPANTLLGNHDRGLVPDSSGVSIIPGPSDNPMAHVALPLGNHDLGLATDHPSVPGA